MKKRKILLLIPFAGLVLSGCTFQEGWQTTTSWLNNNIWTPAKDSSEAAKRRKKRKRRTIQHQHLLQLQLQPHRIQTLKPLVLRKTQFQLLNSKHTSILTSHSTQLILENLQQILITGSS